VPDLVDGPLVSTQGGEAPGDVWYVAVGVGKLGLPMKSARLPARALPKTRSPSIEPSVTPAPKKSDARPIAIWTRPASLASSSSGHGGPGTTLYGRRHKGRSSVMGAPSVGP